MPRRPTQSRYIYRAANTNVATQTLAIRLRYGFVANRDAQRPLTHSLNGIRFGIWQSAIEPQIRWMGHRTPPIFARVLNPLHLRNKRATTTLKPVILIGKECLTLL